MLHRDYTHLHRLRTVQRPLDRGQTGTLRHQRRKPEAARGDAGAFVNHAQDEALLAAIAPTGASRDILNPANGNLVAKVAVDTVDDLEKAIAAATKAQVSWAALGHEKRSALMMKAVDAIEAHAEPLAQLLSREQGKPLNQAKAEIQSGIGYVECEISGMNQRGENIMPGTAVVALPSRGKPLPDTPIDHVSDTEQ
jgi:acyl-CoA reductase-like NAD-dependent aldehyde dehydrogenase